MPELQPGMTPPQQEAKLKPKYSPTQKILTWLGIGATVATLASCKKPDANKGTAKLPQSPAPVEHPIGDDNMSEDFKNTIQETLANQVKGDVMTIIGEIMDKNNDIPIEKTEPAIANMQYPENAEFSINTKISNWFGKLLAFKKNKAGTEIAINELTNYQPENDIPTDVYTFFEQDIDNPEIKKIVDNITFKNVGTRPAELLDGEVTPDSLRANFLEKSFAGDTMVINHLNFTRENGSVINEHWKMLNPDTEIDWQLPGMIVFEENGKYTTTIYNIPEDAPKIAPAKVVAMVQFGGFGDHNKDGGYPGMANAKTIADSIGSFKPSK